jgi:hypothetical protein
MKVYNLFFKLTIKHLFQSFKAGQLARRRRNVGPELSHLQPFKL